MPRASLGRHRHPAHRRRAAAGGPLNAAERLLGPSALERFGGRTALICGDEVVSYATLGASVRRAAQALRDRGVQPGERVLILMRDTPEFAAAWLGAVWAGAVSVALNNRLSESDYRHILADSGARLVIVEEVFAAARPDLTAELARDGRLCLVGAADGWRARVQRARDDTAAHAAGPDTPAFYLYSSGTTGRSKGICHTHRSIDQAGESFRAFGVGGADRVFSSSKFFFAYGLEHGLLAPLAHGATSVLCPDWPDAAAVLDIVARHRISAMFSVPTLYRRLLAEQPAGLQPMRAVRRFVSAGERLSATLATQWRAATGGELLNLYGMSETFCACMVTPPGTSNGLRTGAPLAGVEVRLDDDSGVLWVRHPGQASGYLHLPELTREQFKDGWFCTRDVFARDSEGFFVHQGRSDELVKIAGQWVQPGELEEAVATDDAIAEAACVPVPGEDGVERLALFVVPRGDADDAVQRALAACERALPRHKRPKWVRAVSELPRTATGKVQRYQLREILERELGGRE